MNEKMTVAKAKEIIGDCKNHHSCDDQKCGDCYFRLCREAGRFLEGYAARKEREAKLIDAATDICTSIAGIEGSTTNANLPQWLRARLRVLTKALAEMEGGE